VLNCFDPLSINRMPFKISLQRFHIIYLNMPDKCFDLFVDGLF